MVVLAVLGAVAGSGGSDPRTLVGIALLGALALAVELGDPGRGGRGRARLRPKSAGDPRALPSRAPAELARLDAQRRLAWQALEHAAPCLVIDRALRVVFVNRAYEALVGVSRDEVVGRPPAEAVPLSVAERLREAVTKVARERVGLELELDLEAGPVPMRLRPLAAGGVAAFVDEQRLASVGAAGFVGEGAGAGTLIDARRAAELVDE